ncbi:MAG: polysaccharide biosynthesis tyrosine autokinase [Elusimicrobiota bacterium]
MNSNDGFTLYDYWRILNKRKFAFFSIFLITILATVFYTKLSPPIYSSSAVIKIQPPKIYSQIPGSDVMDIDPWGAVNTEIKVISSIEIAKKAVLKLNLVTSQSELDLNKIALEVLASYKAERVQDTNLISITSYSPNPYKAYDIVNAVIDSYKEYDLEQKSAQAKKTFNDILQRKMEVERKLESLESQKRNFIQKNPNTGMASIISDQISDLEIKKKELMEKYTENHPDVVLIDKKLQTLNARLKQMPYRELELLRIEREIKLQEELYTTINKQYEEAKLGLSSIVSFVTVINPPVLNTTPILPNKKLNLAVGILMGLFLGIVIVFILENLDVSISTIEDIEAFLNAPILGIIPHIRSSQISDNWLVNLFKKERFSLEGFRSALIFNKRITTNIVESYHTLRANIMSNTEKKGSLALVITSAGAAEGKTLTALNLALASSSAGLKTLFVEADFRRPVIHQIFSTYKSPGLADLLVNKADLDEVLRDVTDFVSGDFSPGALIKFPGAENLKIITSGTTPYNPIDIIDNANWKDIIDDMKSYFDLIIFDGPPVLLFVDSIVIGKKVDGAILVYKSGKIARTALKRAKDQITGVGVKMIGVVLNGIKTSELGPRYSYYTEYSEYSTSRR